jgi:hypothetical protein
MMQNAAGLGLDRVIGFSLICVPVRIGLFMFAWELSFREHNTQHDLLQVIAIVIAAGFLVSGTLRYFGLENSTGFAGGEVYWNSFAHGAAYSLFVMLFTLRVDWAWLILFFDVFVGTFGAAFHYAN